MFRWSWDKEPILPRRLNPDRRRASRNLTPASCGRLLPTLALQQFISLFVPCVSWASSRFLSSLLRMFGSLADLPPELGLLNPFDLPGCEVLYSADSLCDRVL